MMGGRVSLRDSWPTTGTGVSLEASGVGALGAQCTSATSIHPFGRVTLTGG